MGRASRRKNLMHPQKIRVRSAQEIAAVMIAYPNLYKDDPFTANLMLLCSELSEFLPVPALDDVEGLREFIKKNMDGLLFQFKRRFKSVDERVIPSLDPPIEIKGTGWIN